jgi:hypothetical protein
MLAVATEPTSVVVARPNYLPAATEALGTATALVIGTALVTEEGWGTEAVLAMETGEIRTGRIIRPIAAVLLIETGRRRTGLAGRPAVSLSPTVKATPGSKLVERVEIFRVTAGTGRATARMVEATV